MNSLFSLEQIQQSITNNNFNIMDESLYIRMLVKSKEIGLQVHGHSAVYPVRI